MQLASPRCRARYRTRRQHQFAIALDAQPLPNFPRLRALALFGRRLAERAESSVLPASKNLHKNGPSMGRLDRSFDPPRWARFVTHFKNFARSKIR